MRTLIVTPHADGFATGNLCSAEQWRGVLVGLGHEVEIAKRYDGQPAELLVALHAGRSHASITAFPGKKVVVLTGTDIYPTPGEEALDSMRRADRIVALQGKALNQVPGEWRAKASVIVQAAPAFNGSPRPDPEHFDVAVVANLREVKAPLLAAAAARILPGTSKVRIRHAGAVLESGFETLAHREEKENARYEWLGSLAPDAALQLIADCDLLAVTSVSEGAGRVVGEAISVGTPVISTRIDGVEGLLGEDYPGYFPVGDITACADLIGRAETDSGFYGSMESACRELAPTFSPAAEVAGWEKLIAEL